MPGSALEQDIGTPTSGTDADVNKPVIFDLSINTAALTMTENVNKYEVFLVGGAVRDELLGLQAPERDWVVVGGTPQQMLDQGYKAVGREFPVFLHPQTNEEYALARIEKKIAPGHRGFETRSSEQTSLEDDLKRRDLTVNAIAKSDCGEIIDPYNGREDISNRVLRHVSPAFSEDPLRVLRVARFSAQLAPFNFSIADETLALMSRLSSAGELSELSADRVWKETEKALSTSRPSLYFEVLRRCGALARLFPEVDALFGVPQRADFHPEIDTGIHTMMVLDHAARLTPDMGVRFAALTHDLGKALTPLSELPRHVGHEKRGLIPLAQLFERYPVPNSLKRIAVPCCEHHLLMHGFYRLRPRTILKLIENLDGFRRPQQVEQFILLCQADSQGRGGMQDRPYPQADSLRNIFSDVQNTGAADLREKDLQGEQIGHAIRELRLQKIRDYLSAREHRDTAGQTSRHQAG